MTLAEAKKLVKKLRADIEAMDKAYYQQSRPVMADFEYDMLKENLARLEAQFPQLKTEATPTAKVGDDRREGFATVRHLAAMLSLDNSYSREELLAFDDRLRRALGGEAALTYMVEPKIDGMAISVVYEQGELVRAVTRGNGDEGEDVTQNFLTIAGVPAVWPQGVAVPSLIELRGEVYMTYAQFEKINAQREAEGQEVYANPRNLAAGTLKQLDSSVVAARGLQALFYAVGACEGIEFATQQAVLDFLKANGWPTHEKVWTAEGVEGAWQAIEQLDGLRKEFAYPTDGAVLKLNSLGLQKEAGFTARSPRWAFAYKYAPERATTKLKEITVQVGRTGVLTPVAELEPVELSGSTVSRATLHNADEIERKDIRVGDWVIIEKAGEVIPAVVSVDTQRRSAGSVPYVFPHECPKCHSLAVRYADEVAWRCANPDCPEQFKRALEHFAGRYAMAIDHLGEAVVEQLVESGLVKNFADLYRLKESDLFAVSYFQSQAAEVKKGEEYKRKMVENLLGSIEKSKANDLWRLIHGLGIPQVGETVSQLLAAQFGQLEALAAATVERLDAVEGIGLSMAESIFGYFAKPQTTQLLTDLKRLGVNTTATATVVATGPLSGQKFVVTGKLTGFTRDQAEAQLKALGATIADSVSKNTTAVVAGQEAGSKLAKAQSLGVRVYTEAEFITLISTAAQ